MATIVQGLKGATTRESPQSSIKFDRLMIILVCWCKCQEESEPSATAKLSHLLAIQTIITPDFASVNSGESESSPLPSSECGYDGPSDLRALLSFARCRRPASIGQTRDWR